VTAFGPQLVLGGTPAKNARDAVFGFSHLSK